MNIKSITLLVTALGLSTGANSAIITHGALSSDDSSNIITDSLNNYDWLRFDVTDNLTYAQTLAVLDTQDGGGWNIAHAVQAIQFVDALLTTPPANACTSTQNTNTTCGNVSGWSDGDFGDDFTADNYTPIGFPDVADVVWFLSGKSNAVGNVHIYDDATGEVTLNGSWSNIADSDSFSDQTTKPNVSWLLYRDPMVVPVPAAVWLFGSGLLGLVGIARRKS